MHVANAFAVEESLRVDVSGVAAGVSVVGKLEDNLTRPVSYEVGEGVLYSQAYRGSLTVRPQKMNP